MLRIEFTIDIDAPREKVWDFYADIQNLPKITPPAIRVRLPHPLPTLRADERFTLTLFQPPFYLPMRWETVFTICRPQSLFVDEQGGIGPFAFWRHEHLFEDLGNGRTRLRDSVTYHAPLGPLGRIADHSVVPALLTAMFAYRHRKTCEALEAQ